MGIKLLSVGLQMISAEQVHAYDKPSTLWSITIFQSVTRQPGPATGCDNGQ